MPLTRAYARVWTRKPWSGYVWGCLGRTDPSRARGVRMTKPANLTELTAAMNKAIAEARAKIMAGAQ